MSPQGYDFGPVTTAPKSLADFVGAYQAQEALQLQRQQQMQQIELTKMQVLDAQRRMAEAQQAAADRQAGRALSTNLLANPPAPEEVVPALPATPATLAHPLGEGEDPEAAALIPRNPGTPGEPAVTAVRQRSLVDAAGGAAALAAGLASPEGRAAVERLKPLTDEEFQARRKKEQGRRDAKAAFDDALRMRGLGDEEGALLAEARGIRALMDGDVAGPRENLMRELDKKSQEFTKVHKDTKEKAAIAKWAPKIEAARVKYNASTPENWIANRDALLETMAQAAGESEHLAQSYQRFLAQSGKDVAEDIESGKINAQAGAFLVARDAEKEAALKAGQPISDQEAYRRAAKKFPVEFSGFLRFAKETKGGTPKALLSAFLGEDHEAPKTIQEEAIRIHENQRLPNGQLDGPQQPGFWLRVSQTATRLQVERHPPKSPADTSEKEDKKSLLQRLGQVGRKINTLETSLRPLSQYDKARPRLEADLREAKREEDGLRQKLAGMGVGPDEVPSPSTQKTREGAKARYNELRDAGRTPEEARQQLIAEGFPPSL